MLRKRHKPEEIVAKLRQVDVLMAQGTPVADAVRSIDGDRLAGRRGGPAYRMSVPGRPLAIRAACAAP